MTNPEHQFRWGRKLIACFEDLRAAFAARSPKIVDREVLPHFDGRADDMNIWLLCERSADVRLTESQMSELKAAVQERMKARGFAKEAIDTLCCAVTSLEDIEAGGGRFYFFR